MRKGKLISGSGTRFSVGQSSYSDSMEITPRSFAPFRLKMHFHTTGGSFYDSLESGVPSVCVANARLRRLEGRNVCLPVGELGSVHIPSFHSDSLGVSLGQGGTVMFT